MRTHQILYTIIVIAIGVFQFLILNLILSEYVFLLRYLGWRINVHDSCDEVPQASEIAESYYDRYDTIEPAASIRHESKVPPSQNFFGQREKNYEKETFKNHNMNESPPKVNVDLQKNSEISKIIADGIRAAEALEDSITRNSSSVLNNQEVYRPDYPRFPDGGMRMPSNKPPYNPSGMPMYVRQPQGVLVIPNPKVQIRRPIHYEKRPMIHQSMIVQQGNPQQSIQQQMHQQIHQQMHQQQGQMNQYKLQPRPFHVPQPSMIVNHYKKPVPNMLRPFVKHKTIPGPLLMVEPTDFKVIKNPLEMTSKGIKPIDLPYSISTKEKMEPLLQIRNEKPMKSEKVIVIKPERLIQKVSSKPLFDIKKSNPFQRPLSEGFKPDSLVIESGFKPILRRREDEEEIIEERAPLFERREALHLREIDHEIDEAVKSEGVYIESQAETKQFEPMFKPSPLESVDGRKSTKEPLPEKLSGDLREMNVEDGEDKMAMAAEQYDTFYLPPEGYPQGAVVTFDGKAVLDTSLVNAAPSNEVKRSHGVSKIELLMRNKPQFGPFRGEIPPLIPEFNPDSGAPIFNNAKNKQPVSEYINPITNIQHNNPDSNEKPISTKLTIVRETEDTRDDTLSRQRREAHHHPDHHGTSLDDSDHQHHSKASSISLTHLLIFLTLSSFVMLNRGQ